MATENEFNKRGHEGWEFVAVASRRTFVRAVSSTHAA
jgi:hypothetical protein